MATHNRRETLWPFGLMIAMMIGGLTHLVHGAETLKLDFSQRPLARLRERAEARKTKLTIKRCDAPPVVDGEINDAAWARAATASLPGAPLTAVKFCFDDASLYLCVICEEEPGYNRVAKEHPRDGAVYNDDCLEIFFLPPAAEPVFYQFVINAVGSIYDGRGQISSYDPDWSHAVKRNPNGWTVEMAFPYAALELDGPVASLGFNMHRVGPNFPIRSFAKPEREPGAAILLFEGVPPKAFQPTEEQIERKHFVMVRGNSLVVRPDRLVAEAGESWLPIELFLRPTAPLARTCVEARLFPIGKSEPMHFLTARPERVEGVLKVNLRAAGLSQARVEMSVLEDGISTGAAEMLLSQRPCTRPLKRGERVPVWLDLAEGVSVEGRWPVTFGIPFPAGSLWEDAQGSAPIRLVDNEGKEIPSQFEVMARWAPEGSVKWLRADALISPNRGCFLEGADPSARAAPSLRVSELGAIVTIETGPARFVLGKGASPIREIWHGGRRVATSENARGLYLIAQDGRLACATAKDEMMDIEARGPVAACVRFEGWYATADDQLLARHVTRVEAFVGETLLRVTHTLILTEDTNKVWFKDVGWELRVESGESPKALFGLAPPATDWRKSISVPLKGKTRAAYMLQDSHYRFGQGKNHFSVVAIGVNGEEELQHEGERCGDWAALRGGRGALLVACRDTARQHPKEFEISADRVVLHLFSNRAEEELDYRTTTLMKRWNLSEWIKLYNQKDSAHGRRDEKEMIRALEGYTNDASGGARTHDLLFAACGPESSDLELARIGGLHGEPIYALVDPQWIYQSRVMGPNHPLDMTRFPEAEKGVRAALQYFLDCDTEWGEHGFIDYFAGPHCARYMEGRVPSLFRYIESTYFFRAQIWLLYARSGERAIRRFAEGTNRAYLDNRFVHWGEHTGHFRLDNSGYINMVPIYWHKSYRLLEFGELVSNFLRHYYLTGDRRMKDGLLECAKAYKNAWSETMVVRDWTKSSILQHCAQFYAFTEDEEFGAMADRTLDLITDPRNGLLLAKRAYNSTTYKAGQAFRHLLEAYWHYPSQKLLSVCKRVAEYLQQFPYRPFGYTPTGSICAPFLYDLAPDPAQAQSLALALRDIGGLYDPATGKLASDMREKVGILPYTTFLFDIGYVIHAVRHASQASAPNIASWVSYTDPLGKARAIVRKEENELLRLHYEAESRPRVVALDTAVNQVTRRDISVMSIREDFGSYERETIKGEILMPKDVPAGDYMIEFQNHGYGGIFASSRAKLVLYAPDYWMPLPQSARPGVPADRQNPPWRYYFSIPENVSNPQIFFSTQARLYDPAGNVTEQTKGWVNLPQGKPGLWSFVLHEQGMIRTRNIPPFFAFNDPHAYFEPQGLDWRSDSPAEEPPLPADSLYVPGPSGRPDDRALYLFGRKYFQINPPKGMEQTFIPNLEGTLEFHIRPNWNFFDMKPGETRGLVAPGLFVEQRPDSIVFSWNTDGKIPKAPFAGYRVGPSLLLKDRWTHLAIVWGPTRNPEVIWGQYGAKSITSQTKAKKLDITIFVNGKRALQTYTNHPIPAEGQSFLPVQYLVIGGLGQTNRLDAAIDNVRLSDIQRYFEDFAPPPREYELRLDPHTRAIFLFDGNLKGVGSGLDAPLEGVVRE